MSTQVAVGTKAAVGFSEKTSSREAGAEAAQRALDQLENDRCDLVLLFATSKYDPALIREGVRSVVGNAPLFGGSAVGVITNDKLGYEGYQVGVALIASDTMKFEIFIERGVSNNEYGVGRGLGEQIRARGMTGSESLLLLYDIVKAKMSDGGMKLNMATPLLQGLRETIGDWSHVAGCGTMGDMQWNPSFQWFKDSIEQQSAMALVISEGLQLDTVTIHGARPSSTYYTITKAEGNNVLELDGRPTAQVISDLLGPNSNTPWEGYPLFITLGVNKGDKFGEYNDDDYAVRLCMGVDRERGGLLMFGDDLTAGCEVQLMRRSVDFSYIKPRVEELLKRIGKRKPVLALYIDCAGRAAAYAGTEREDAADVQKAIGPTIPLLGWYVGCEIARAGPSLQSHNWTGVLSVLSVE